MIPKNDTIIDLSVTTTSVLISIDNTQYEYLLTSSPVETPKPSSKHADAT